MTEVMGSDPAVIASSDGHVGPRLVEDLRPYCPAKHRDDFDMFAQDVKQVRDFWLAAPAPGATLDVHYDSAARAKTCESDGVAVEVLFHFSFNGELMPFVPNFTSAENPIDEELALVGMRIYNAWLADFCKQLPGRRVGLAYLPFWDLDAAVDELKWAADAGLRGVNFPAMRPNLLPYDEPAYDTLWAAAQDLNMPLTTHAGAVDPTSWTRASLLMLEVAGPLVRRSIHRMIFAGVFDRFPGLKLVMTEQPGLWEKSLLVEMDSAYKFCERLNGNSACLETTLEAPRPDKWRGLAANTIPQQPLRQKPSDYFHSNIFIGKSFMAHFEAVALIDQGLDEDAVMWGSDFPHPEGLWNPNDDDPTTGQFRRALCNTFQNLPYASVKKMLATNLIRCYGLDEDYLEKVAADIHAPTYATVTTPPVGELDALDGGVGSMSFRKEAAWT